MATGTEDEVTAESLAAARAELDGQGEFGGMPQPLQPSLGGMAPKSQTIKFGGHALEIPLDQTLENGAIITGTFTACIVGKGQRHKKDGQTGQVVDCTQVHLAQFEAFEIDE